MMYKDKDGDGWITAGASEVSCVFIEDGWLWIGRKCRLESLVENHGAEVVLPEEYMK